MGAPGSSSSTLMSASNKKRLLANLDRLWPVARDFYQVVYNWRQQLNAQGGGNLMMGMMMGNLMGASGGSGISAALAESATQPPETDDIIDAARGMTNEINKIFAGYGVYVARCLAGDMTRIKSILERPDLPGLMGASSRDDMIRSKLKIEMPWRMANADKTIIGFLLGAQKLGAGEVEPELVPLYIVQLANRGDGIPWELIGQSSLSNKSTVPKHDPFVGGREEDSGPRY